MTASIGPETPLGALPAVGPQTQRRLQRLGLETVRDLLLFSPFGLDEYGRPGGVGKTRPGELAAVSGRLLEPHSTGARGRRRIEAGLVDSTGARLRLVWFNQPYLARRLPAGQEVVAAGRLRETRFGLEMVNPRLSLGQEAPVAPFRGRYHLTRGLRREDVERLVALVLPLADGLQDALPEELRGRLKLPPLADALRELHHPTSADAWKLARRRMALAELVELQAAFMLSRERIGREAASPVAYRQEVIDTFKRHLGFELTLAQRRAAWEVFKDLARARPMNRLLNGDVGAGKTAVAAAAVAMVHGAGLQAMVMAPTDVLARQHLEKFRAYLEPAFPTLKVELLVSRQGAAERRRVLTAAASGAASLVVGTHSLIEEAVEMASLGLVVVDEQHRFGTRQRDLLRGKSRGAKPHFLAMTATPIPRTLVLALYGEMELSTLDELPPGRVPVDTRVIPPEKRQQAYDLIREEVTAGRQAFVICPLVETSETLAARAATAEYEHLKSEFSGLEVGLVYGRAADKEGVMNRFRQGVIQILVATAVVEVGVDIPNASVILIEGADRFGLAQLHQFRGRVGRGSHPSFCLLACDDPAAPASRRLEAMARITDGFELARLDLEERGGGELMGSRQHGAPDAAMDALLRPELLSEAREEAERLSRLDPSFGRWPELKAAAEARLAAWSRN